MIYILKHRAQNLLVSNNAPRHIRKPPHNGRLCPVHFIIILSCIPKSSHRKKILIPLIHSCFLRQWYWVSISARRLNNMPEFIFNFPSVFHKNCIIVPTRIHPFVLLHSFQIFMVLAISLTLHNLINHLLKTRLILLYTKRLIFLCLWRKF